MKYVFPFALLVLLLIISLNSMHATQILTQNVMKNSMVTVTGNVTNHLRVPINGAEVEAIDSSGAVVASTMTNNDGAYSLSVAPGRYDIKAIPPAGSGFTPTVLLAQLILTPTIIDFILVPSGICTLSGQITDRDGIPVSQQVVRLTSFTDFIDTTDNMGNYSFTVAPGTYTFTIPSQPGIVPLHFPENFYLSATDISLPISTILNIQIPNVALTVTVLDLSNNPIPGSTIATELAMTSTIFNAGSVIFRGNIGTTGVTDTAGKVVLWMFPTKTDLKITPPLASGFVPMHQDSVSIQADTALTVHLVPGVTLSGQITDRDGIPVSQQVVRLTSFTDFIDTTDNMGNYSFTVAPGTYTFTIPSQPGIVPLHFPENFYLNATDISLFINTVLNIQIPNVALTVTVLDTAGNPVAGATIATDMAMTSTIFNAGSVIFRGNISTTGVTDTAGKVVLWMFPTKTDLKITPPLASGFVPMHQDSVSIQADTALTVHLVPGVTLSGQITDRDGIPVSQQVVRLTSFTNFIDTTDNMGNYSFTVAPGTYTFTIPSQPGIVPLHFPENFYLSATDISLPISTVLNIQIPNVALTVTVLDLSNNPIPGSTIATELAMTSTTFNAGSVIFRGNSSTIGVTDTAGKVVLWMFTTTTDLKITPPAGSGFLMFKVDSVVVVSDISLVIHLESVTGVRGGTVMPAEFMLLQNYPNPFNPSTVISYRLPVISQVTLKVYDILGKEVATLVNETKEAGSYEVQFSASQLASGVYFYKLQLGNFSLVKKLLLMK